MKITVNNKPLEVSGQEPLIEVLRQAGCHVPSLCYNAEAEHRASCMVCVVRNAANGQMLPSCSTYPTEGMQIETDTDEVLEMRRTSLELLLSDHRADCEAPCTVVCPNHLDVAQLILYYDRGQMAQAQALLQSVFDLQNLPCQTCKAGCEKACRRGTLDEAVQIRDIIRQVAAYKGTSATTDIALLSHSNTSKETFSSRLGRYSEAEKAWLKEVYTQPSRCLHCACEGSGTCKLRALATEARIKSSRFGVSSSLPVKEVQHVNGRLYFEPAKCIRCGLCVYNSQDGFTFQHRGFDMRVVIPEESKSHVGEDVAELCPTGALYLKNKWM